jgi:hypothetical protein
MTSRMGLRLKQGHPDLSAFGYAGDDLTVTMRVLGDLARAQQVDLHLPTVWRREDPWRGLG